MEYLLRDDVLSKAAEECMKALYKEAQPKVEWEDFIKQNKEYKEGPRPYEFYYLPKEVFDDIVGMYHHAYRIPPEIKGNIETLIRYFDKPIRDKYIERNGDTPGYRSYENFTPLKDIIGEDNLKKVIEYMNEAADFYKWDRDLQAFNITVYLGASPNSNKEAVIENWKKYKGIDITIDESVYKYDEDDD